MRGATSTVFLSGDVMTGRGIDQILPHPSAPQIFEGYLKDARGYLELAEQASGAIPIPADFGYPWGDALSVWEKMSPDLRIINLETSVTTSEDYWKVKGINYRMHPANAPCLTQARIDACSLANNHVLDWGYSGLRETLSTLQGAGVKTAGAGRDQEEASAPARLEVPGKGVVHLFSFGLETSGIPAVWGATGTGPGVNLLPDLSHSTVSRIAAQVKAVKREGDTAIASLHWGDNWGFDVTRGEIQFAHRLIEAAGVDIVHG
ncbi:MAG TPA: CapA family protein, partial [Geomonas sp.]